MNSILKNQIKSFNKSAAKSHLLPIKVTSFYEKKVLNEIKRIGTGGPLYKAVFPTPSRFKIRADGEVPDFVEDHKNMPPNLNGFVIQKYPDRLLFLTTEHCAGHCQYCFRTFILSGEQNFQKMLPKFQGKLDAIINYINENHRISEVIFSGGDPLTISHELIKLALDRLIKETRIRNFRIHTRTIIYAPEIFTSDLCNTLKKYGVRLYFHIIHPYEICKVVKETIQRIHSYDVKMYNQFPILRGINDNAEVLEMLMRTLDKNHIRQISIFIPDPINYSSTYRIPLKRHFNIIDTLNWKTPSWVNSGRVVLDSPVGKVRRENIKSWDTKRGIITFEREGHQVEYIDFPEELDEPSSKEILLWQNKS